MRFIAAGDAQRGDAIRSLPDLKTGLLQDAGDALTRPAIVRSDERAQALASVHHCAFSLESGLLRLGTCSESLHQGLCSLTKALCSEAGYCVYRSSAAPRSLCHLPAAVAARPSLTP